MATSYHHSTGPECQSSLPQGQTDVEELALRGQISQECYEVSGSSNGHPQPPLPVTVAISSKRAALNAAQLKDRKQKRRFFVKKLEKKLEILNKQIERFSEAELSLDEMNSGSSTYLKEDLLKRKFVKTWQKICDLQGIPDEIVIEDQEGATYAETPYPEINRRGLTLP